MLYYKRWYEGDKYGFATVNYEGWFLFGFIPLFIRRLGNHYK
jgi:hypothetical protein